MFKDTLMVIGAGAHKPYGYPTGLDLKKIIQLIGRKSTREVKTGISSESWLNHHYKIANEIEEFNFSNRWNFADLLNEFIDDFSNSQLYSIDAFLARKDFKESQREYPEVGKLLVYYIIDQFEKNILPGYTEEDWIEHILNKHLRDKDNLKEFFHNPPSIITFNYDQLFEVKLSLFLIGAHGYSKEEAIDLVESLNITHIYGSTKNLRHLILKNKQARHKSFKGVKVIGEDREEQELNNFFKKLNESTHIYFLGFGFDEENMKLLRMNNNELWENKKIVGTAIGLKRQDLIQVQRFCPNIHLSPNSDCLDLISQEFPIFEIDLPELVGVIPTKF